MIILSENGRKLIDANSVYIHEQKDFSDRTKTIGYKVMGVVSGGRPISLKTFSDVEDAEEYIKEIYHEHKAN